MLKILTTKQLKELDAYTIQHEPIPSIDLMERACRAFVTWFAERFDTSAKIGIVCGTGNNGGDGLGIARLLNECGYPVVVWIVRTIAPESDDFKVNLSRLLGKLAVQDITTELDENVFQDRSVLIDAIFGSGLSRPVQGIYAQTIECMNKAGAICVAVDIPSGLLADAHSEGVIVWADYTVSFQLPKLAFLLPENHLHVGEWFLVDIGLNKEFIKKTESSFRLLQKKDMQKIRHVRSKFDHKGTFGRALLVAGSYGKIGAAVLAAKAALRSGVGLLTVHLPACGYDILQTAVPEAMVNPDVHPEFLTAISQPEGYDAVGIGPGIGQSNETLKALASILEKSTQPIVIDADGLNLLAGHREYLHLIPKESILTPHLKEFERLAGASKNDFDRLEKLKEFSSKTNTIVVLKGGHTAIAHPGGIIYFNSTGNPGMATGGTGDVLTGMLTSLLAQGYSPLETALYGVYLHGLSGDLASREKSLEALIASDIVEFLPQAFLNLSY